VREKGKKEKKVGRKKKGEKQVPKSARLFYLEVSEKRSSRERKKKRKKGKGKRGKKGEKNGGDEHGVKKLPRVLYHLQAKRKRKEKGGKRRKKMKRRGERENDEELEKPCTPSFHFERGRITVMGDREGKGEEDRCPLGHCFPLKDEGKRRKEGRG